MMFRVPRQRPNRLHSSRRLIVNISSRPSNRLSAAEGYSWVSHCESVFRVPCR
jgi:hypothetical protein